MKSVYRMALDSKEQVTIVSFFVRGGGRYDRRRCESTYQFCLNFNSIFFHRLLPYAVLRQVVNNNRIIIIIG